MRKNPKRYDIQGPKASTQFIGVLGGGGGPDVECGFCGREHYAIDSEYLVSDWENLDERIQTILDHAKEKPDDVVIERNVDAIHYFYIDGMAIPDNCPCNGLRKYENFFWENRSVWKNYLAVKKLSLQSDIDSIGDIGEV